MTTTTYFRGYRVNLTGSTEALHGGVFYSGVYAEGPRKGQPVLVSERIARQDKERERVAARTIEMAVYTR